MPKRPLLIALLIALLAPLLGCGGSDPKAQRSTAAIPIEVQERLPLAEGIGGMLCPPTDVPQHDEGRGKYRRSFEEFTALIRKNPDARVIVKSYDADSGDIVGRGTQTVREVGQRRLSELGENGAPCARSTVSALEDAVERTG
jgi:hypothetical protein